jgi:hypothetical protein
MRLDQLIFDSIPFGYPIRNTPEPEVATCVALTKTFF